MLFRTILFTAVLAGLVTSCTDPAPATIPANVLPKDQMAAVFTDFTIMEAAINVSHYNAGVAGSDSLRFNIYRQHNISRAVYDSSLAFYSKHPEEFKQVYDLVIDKLSKLQ